MLGNTNKRTFRAASVIELIHTATLVHDDVVDDSNKRRGFFSINALWKNKTVLVGDYLLSKGLLLCIDNKDFDLLEIISTAVREMRKESCCKSKKPGLDITEEVYYEVIRKNSYTNCIMVLWAHVLLRVLRLRSIKCECSRNWYGIPD